jgi:hypothetical protein
VEYVIVAVTAALVAALTLFSGFGLGTLLLPAFAAFFPVEVAVAATAVVHLANNLFKLALVGRHADRRTVIAFALPAVPAALAGAWCLGRMARLPVIASYRVPLGFTAEITGARLVIGALIIVFALFDLVPRLRRVAIDRRYLPLGGVLAGFFGGLSGHQGALRSAFLVKAGLDRDAFIGTSVVAAVIVDVARLAVYGVALRDTALGALANDRRLGALVLVATAAAFLGSYLGARLVPKVTIDAVQTLVGTLVVAFGAGIAAGWI